jgi:hypothetical protein
MENGHFSWAIGDEMAQSKDCSFCVPCGAHFLFNFYLKRRKK